MKRYKGIIEAKTYFYFDTMAEDKEVVEANAELLIELDNFKEQGDVKIVRMDEYEIQNQ